MTAIPTAPPHRLAWALVHSRRRADVVRGVEVVQAALSMDAAAGQRDLRYLLAVGQYRERHYLDARETLKGLLEVGGDLDRRARVHGPGGEADSLQGRGAQSPVRAPRSPEQSACLDAGRGALRMLPSAACTRGDLPARKRGGRLARRLLCTCTSCAGTGRLPQTPQPQPAYPPTSPIRLRHPCAFPPSTHTQASPEFRQASTLLTAVEADIVKDGLVGVGAGAALLGVIGAIAYAAMRKR